ncbi:MAG: alcohol dehydrogenase catalytic domain-containing protein [Lachnospiraceae bacterium]|nr:alcohol dehydrogenase catalytic domain-containing protein [Lachnospiraceae bacterium]
MQKMMKVGVLKKFGEPIVIEERPVPTPGPGEVLIKTVGCGLCGSDLHIRDGKIPTVPEGLIPGHEPAGIIAELGEGVTGWEVGQHVIISIDITCGTCDLCRKGAAHLCRNRVRIGFERNGGYEEYFTVPTMCLIPIREDIPLDEACIVTDAVATMHHAIVDRGQVKAGDRVLIYGAGALGIQGVQIAKYLGAEVFVSGRTQAKLDACAQFGADHCINTREQNLQEELMRLSNGEGMDVILDLVGVEDSVKELMKVLRPAGVLVEIGYSGEEFPVNYMDFVVKEKAVLGIRGTTKAGLRECIRLLEEGVVTPYIYKKYRLEDVNEALKSLEEFTSIGRSVISFAD